MQTVASTLVNLVQLYLAAGLIFAIIFVLGPVKRTDPAARDGSVGFRILIVPGVAALWPWLLARRIRGGNADR